MVFNMCFPKSGGNAIARSTAEDARKNMEIEKMLRKDKKNQGKQVKILLLGAGESGKSTILKQMRIIYSEGFRLEERKEVRQVIFSNMIVAFKIIAEEMRELGLEYEIIDSHVCQDMPALEENPADNAPRSTKLSFLLPQTLARTRASQQIVYRR